jgi:peptide/nickel transport system substrate-binding protein
MSTFRKRIVGGVALALAGTTALAACSSSSSSNKGTGGNTNNGSVGLSGQFGQVPAEATGTQHAGTITVAAPPNSAPTWILPIVTGAANSVYTVPEFDYNMYRPLYWFLNGVAPKETPSMSLANAPTWSSDDKTVTITLKSNYKWSDGQAITSQDLLFWFYLLKAALKESPANWAYYTPGLGIPDEIASISRCRRTPGRSTRPAGRPSPTGPPTRPTRRRSTTTSPRNPSRCRPTRLTRYGRLSTARSS